jgi:hypothetical protein
MDRPLRAQNQAETNSTTAQGNHSRNTTSEKPKGSPISHANIGECRLWIFNPGNRNHHDQIPNKKYEPVLISNCTTHDGEDCGNPRALPASDPTKRDVLPGIATT